MIGFYATLAGIGAGLILARCADLFGGKMKALLLVLFFGAAGCFLWFSLLCLRMIEYAGGKFNSSPRYELGNWFFVDGQGTWELQAQQGHPWQPCPA